MVSHSNSADVSVTKIQLITSLFSQTLIPAIVEVCYACLKNQVIANIGYQLLPSVFTFLVNILSRSLSSIHRSVSYTEPLKSEPQPSILSSIPKKEIVNAPEQSVCSCVLYEPGAPIQVDVIFVHGLHGSLVNTWRQGLWGNRNQRVWLQSRSSDGLSITRKLCYRELGRRIFDILLGISNKNSRREDKFLHATACEPKCEIQEDNEPYSKCWPQDWIPKDCPGTRVIAVNYVTDPYLWKPIWMRKHNGTSMIETSSEMVKQLLKLEVGKYPIVWVGHSKGGLFIKQILAHCWEETNITADLKKVCRSTKAIMFYSVPHKGSYLADITVPLLYRSIELMELRKDCPFILELHRRFLRFLDESSISPKIFSFVETSLTLLGYIYLRIVQQESADPGIGTVVGVPLDHREICKPSSRKCFLYRELVRLINYSINNVVNVQNF